MAVCAASIQCAKLVASSSIIPRRRRPTGDMVWRWWRALPEKYPSVVIDVAEVMPNHFHGVIVIHDTAADPADAPVGAAKCGRPVEGPPAVGDIVAW
jgi:hypothetical protein